MKDSNLYLLLSISILVATYSAVVRFMNQDLTETELFLKLIGLN